MPRPRPPHLQRELSRHGRAVWYVRKGDGPRIRIRGEYGSTAFLEAYNAAVRGELVLPDPKSRTGSLRWLWDRYRQTEPWAALAIATRRQRENIMQEVLKSAGAEPYGDISSAAIEAGKDRRAKTPSQARNFLDAMRALFRWAKTAGLVSVDPTAGVANPKKRKGPGFIAWTEADVEAYQRKWPLGTRQRVWLDMLLYAGPRRGDVVRLGRQHMQTIHGPQKGQRVYVMVFRTEKGSEQIEVVIPILPVLWDTLEAGPCGDLAFIVGERGEPLTKESFGNMFSAAARAAGVKKSAHGVRKIAATTAANNGATVHQLMAIIGWKTSQMAEFYTREANRRRLAMDAIHMLARTPQQRSIPAPSPKVRG